MVKKLANINRVKRETSKFTRPEGAGNFDNMDDKNIVDQINIKIGTCDLAPTDPKHIVNKEYVDNISFGSAVNLFNTNDLSTDIPLYGQLILTVPEGEKQEVVRLIEASASGQFLGATATEADSGAATIINTILAGVQDSHIHLQAATANRITVFFELYKRTAGGVETLLGTSGESELIRATETLVNLATNTSEDTPLDPTDRIVTKLYANNAFPVATNLSIFVEGNTSTRIVIQGLTTPLSHDSLIDVTSDQHHDESHTIVSHSDTTATGTELDTLTDDSMADTLHRHSELSASDGTPNPALSVDADGDVGIGTTSPGYKLEINGTLFIGGVDSSLRMARGDGFASPILKIESSTDNVIIGNSSIDEIRFDVDDKANAMVIKTDGDVGIGTTIPAQKLDVNGAVRADDFIEFSKPMPEEEALPIIMKMKNKPDGTLDHKSFPFSFEKKVKNSDGEEIIKQNVSLSLQIKYALKAIQELSEKIEELEHNRKV